MGVMALYSLLATSVLLQCYFSTAEPLLRSKDHAGYSHGHNRWGLKTDDSSNDLTWLNNMPVEGLLSIYRNGGGGKHLHPSEMAQFRNNEPVLEDHHLGQGNRRMSITNAMDILRERLLRAIKRKQTEDYQDPVWSEPGLLNIG